MNQHEFNSIVKKMERKYGKMKKGEEEAEYAGILFPMESNLMKTHRKYPDSNSRRLEEAILLALHFINSKLTGEEEDLSRFESEENLRLRDAMLATFDPFFNQEIAEQMKAGDGGSDLEDPAFLEELYRVPVLCILRIRDSVELWFKKRGSNGYFDFIEYAMGNDIKDNDEMDFFVYGTEK